MTTSTAAYSATSSRKALLPWLGSIVLQQWKAWKAARRAARADELTWKMAMQDARMMADLSRAMSDTAQRH